MTNAACASYFNNKADYLPSLCCCHLLLDGQLPLYRHASRCKPKYHVEISRRDITSRCFYQIRVSVASQMAQNAKRCWTSLGVSETSLSNLYCLEYLRFHTVCSISRVRPSKFQNFQSWINVPPPPPLLFSLSSSSPFLEYFDDIIGTYWNPYFGCAKLNFSTRTFLSLALESV